MKIKSLLSTLLILLCLMMSTNSCFSQTKAVDENEKLVHSAVEDYVLGLYQVEPERIARSVDTLLYKIGYYEYNGESYNHVPMTYKQLFDLAAKWNLKGDQANDDSPLKIEIYDVNDKTASAKLTAVWGIDLMHLSKVNGMWKIMNIMWQSNPK